MKDEFGIDTTAATTPGLLKAFMNEIVLYVREVDGAPQELGVVLRTAAKGLWQNMNDPNLISQRTTRAGCHPYAANYSRRYVPDRTGARLRLGGFSSLFPS